ncbi:glycosyltransferase family 4 protein [Butyrivibrio sp. YAB3001]|uniref:glycosyltransferase family 4 protein n=1 Tax=Butyrivibrio sp. YAB3001 TaxID=1520812 RepID=UPI0008F62877|nr:glycosyltransferase family 4 protein [Butyrivibrio sp. YAB3001]SFC26847.1 Glycosyltransferase involved in cell wall bisynthesis [Butyrivibrio sp. YAB3001]
MLENSVKGKKVLFITTKNIDYIRNTQEIRILKENADELKIIHSVKKNYALRIIDVWGQILKSRRKRASSGSTIQDCDVIFIGFAPQLVLPFLGRKFKGKQIIIDFFISVYDTLICDRKLFRKGGFIAFLSHKLDEVTIRKADYIITDTKAHAKFFVEEFGADQRKTETIYLEADQNIYYPRVTKNINYPNDKVKVLYFGSILPLQGVDIVLDAIRLLKDNANIAFEVIGPIPQKYNKPIQDNVKYIDWLSQEELANHIADADLCLAGHFNKEIKKADRTIPGKAYIYEAMGKAMILGNSSGNRELFQEDESHIFVEMGNAMDLAKKIRNWSVNREEKLISAIN